MIVGGYQELEELLEETMEEPFTIVRHWAGMESMILITNKLWSGLSNRFVKVNIVALLHGSMDPISNRPMEKRSLRKTDFC